VTPTVLSPGTLLLGNDNTLVQEFTVLDPGADAWTVNVVPGDGTPRVFVPVFGRTFRLNHTYPGTGYFRVEMEVSDDDGDRSFTQFYVVTGVPALAIGRVEPGSVEVSWSAHPAPFRLESSTQLPGVGAAWATVMPAPEQVGNRRVIQFEISQPARFFRLTLP
jgi:hypothetical protein